MIASPATMPATVGTVDGCCCVSAVMSMAVVSSVVAASTASETMSSRTTIKYGVCFFIALTIYSSTSMSSLNLSKKMIMLRSVHSSMWRAKVHLYSLLYDSQICLAQRLRVVSIVQRTAVSCLYSTGTRAGMSLSSPFL